MLRRGWYYVLRCCHSDFLFLLLLQRLATTEVRVELTIFGQLGRVGAASSFLGLRLLLLLLLLLSLLLLLLLLLMLR